MSISAALESAVSSEYEATMKLVAYRESTKLLVLTAADEYGRLFEERLASMDRVNRLYSLKTAATTESA